MEGTMIKIVPWEGNWTAFKTIFSAMGLLNGIDDALEAGEIMASGKPWMAMNDNEGEYAMNGNEG